MIQNHETSMFSEGNFTFSVTLDENHFSYTKMINVYFRGYPRLFHHMEPLKAKSQFQIMTMTENTQSKHNDHSTKLLLYTCSNHKIGVHMGYKEKYLIYLAFF